MYNPLYDVMYPFLLVFERKVPFVDESTITVNYDECIGRGSYGTVYRGSVVADCSVSFLSEDWRLVVEIWSFIVINKLQ